jgi:hypothetical protein
MTRTRKNAQTVPADTKVGQAAAEAAPAGKLGILIWLLERPQGATIAEMVEETGWQAHSVRGAMSGTLKKRKGLTVTSEKVDGARTYRIAGTTAA